MYFNQTRFSHGSFTETAIQCGHGCVAQSSISYVRQENLKQVAFHRENHRIMTMANDEKRAETMPWGTPAEVATQLVANAERCGAATLLVSMNHDRMPHEMFLNQARRSSQEVLSRLRAPQITRVPATEEVMA